MTRALKLNPAHRAYKMLYALCERNHNYHETPRKGLTANNRGEYISVYIIIELMHSDSLRDFPVKSQGKSHFKKGEKVILKKIKYKTSVHKNKCTRSANAKYNVHRSTTPISWKMTAIIKCRCPSPLDLAV